MAEFAHLLSPGKIGSLEIRNRLLQTAMGSNLAYDGGFFGDELIAYHEARARGGVGLIITEAVAVGYPQGAALSKQVAVSHDKYVPGLKKLTDAVHQHGAKMALQLHFGGIMAARDMVDGREVWVPSMPSAPAGAGMQQYLFPEERAMTQAVNIKLPVRFRVMEQTDIDQLVEWFASGALRAKQAGFDAVEIHGGHGYIIAGFLSPLTNSRDDEYGGSRENRARLLQEITEAVRDRVGPDFPMWCKLDAAEYFYEGGLAIEDVCHNAQVAEAAGANAITVTATHDYTIARALTSSYLPHEPAKLVPLAAQVKAAVNIPVITVGRIDPDVADQAIADGKFDFMAMGRKQLADPDFANNLAKGGAEDVRPCIYCYTCLSQAMVTQPLRCSVNGDLGFEKDALLAPAKRPKRVVVVGGGPGGMEAARRLTLRGHQVTLIEASDQLGGTARIAAIAYAPNGDFVNWLKRQMDRLQVKVSLNTQASAATVSELAPEAVIVATGAARHPPDLPGKDQPHVFSVVDSERWDQAGPRVVIIGSDHAAFNLAEHLTGLGRQVTMIDDVEQMGRGLSPTRRSVMLEELPLAGVVMHPAASAISIGANAVSFTTSAGEAMTTVADAVILAKGAEPEMRLHDELAALGVETHAVGDCQGVGYIIGAVRNAADVAARV